MAKEQRKYSFDWKATAKAYVYLAVAILFFLLLCEIAIFISRLVLS